MLKRFGFPKDVSVKSMENYKSSSHQGRWKEDKYKHHAANEMFTEYDESSDVFPIVLYLSYLF